MKIKRYKTARKVLAFYKTHFGLRTPYQVLVDGTCCQAALKGKIQLKEQLPKYLGGPVQLVTTVCILKELRSLGPKLSGAYYIANRLQLRSCGHKAGQLPAAQCIDSFIGDVNDHHYLVASQDNELRQKLRKRPGIPLFHIIRNTIVLEPPSTSSKTKSQESSLGKTAPSEYEKSVITKLNDELPVTETQKRRKRRRLGGPNPLSMKKSTKKSIPDKPIPTGGVVTGSKKRRIRLQRRKAIEQLTKNLAVEHEAPV